MCYLRAAEIVRLRARPWLTHMGKRHGKSKLADPLRAVAAAADGSALKAMELELGPIRSSRAEMGTALEKLHNCMFL